jgi:superfamily II DNA or RNA helicase
MHIPDHAAALPDMPLVLTVGAGAILQGAPAPLAAALRQQLTIDNPKFNDARKYGRWIGKQLKPHLYFYEEGASGISFPRGFANQAIRMCRRYASRLPQVVDRRRERPSVDLSFAGSLRHYQQEALQNLLRRDFGVLEAGTGSGKTVIALAVIASRRQPTLILVHTRELLYQWGERIEQFLGCKAGLLGDGHCDLQPVTVAIVNTARKQLADLPQRFGQICVDECHRVPTSLFTDVVQAFDSRYSLGLSATAFRRDGLTRLIYYFLGDRAHLVDRQELQTAGAVLQPEIIQRPTTFAYFYRGNYQELMNALTRNEPRNRQIVADVETEVSRTAGTILVVSDRIAHCERLVGLLANQGIRAALLTGQTPGEERSRLVAAIHAGELAVLVSTVQLIGEGFDCPGLSTLFLTTPIKFTGRVLQVVGRILRPAAGKRPRVYDYVDPIRVLQASASSRLALFQEG